MSKELITIKKYYEVIKKILELLNTMEEGLNYIKEQLAKLKYEEALVVLNDLTDALSSIENSMKPMEVELPENQINELSSMLKVCLDKAIKRFQQNDEINVNNLVEQEIIPDFKNWKAEVEKVLKPYVTS